MAKYRFADTAKGLFSGSQWSMAQLCYCLFIYGALSDISTNKVQTGHLEKVLSDWERYSYDFNNDCR